MPDSTWVFAIEENKLQKDDANMVFPKGLPVLIIKRAGEIYAISNKCVHMACGLAGGMLKDYIIKCPCHDWRYDIRTGEFLDAKEIKLQVYEWKLSDGKIFIKIGEGNQE